MKQQFLNDSGLTELIGYIKKYVKDEQDVKPYASLSVFPKTGEQNIIYIDTTVNASYYWDDTSKTYKALDVQTWTTLNGKPTTFPPEDHNHDDRYFTETEMNSKLAGKADSSHTHKKADITDFPTSMPASDVPAWAKASTKPTYTKAEVGLGNVDNTADKDKSVKYATSAGSAGTASSVDWSGVKNSPSTYAPSAHTHGSGDITSLSADKITGVIGIDHLPAGALERCKIVADDTARFKLTTSDVQNGDVVKVGTDANAKMYFVIDETKLSSEDGYTVFSAGTATSVPWSGVTGKPSTFTPSAHTHDDRYYTESEINTKLDSKSNTGHTHDDRYYTESEMNTKLAGKSDTSHSHNLSTMINTLVEGTSAPTDDDYYIAQYAGGGTTNTTYTRRLHSALWSYIKGKADSVYQAKGSYAASSHTHTIAQISNLQTILDSKASASHTHTIANVTGLQSALDGKAASVHSHSYLPLSGGTLTGALNFANGIWNVVGDDVAIGDMNIGGTLGVMGKNGNTSIKLVQYGASTTNGEAAPGVAWTCTGNGASTISGTLSGTFSGSLSGNASSATALTSSAGSTIQPIYFSGGKPVACSYTLGKSVPSNAVFTDTNTWRPLGTTADTACAGNDSRLSNARPASDVYSWAKASSKPSYSWGEISGKPSTFTPSSHTHNYLLTQGNNTIASTTDDTTAKWGAKQTSVHFYNTAGKIKDQPSQYGYLFNVGNGSEVHQLWLAQPGESIAHRGGNANNWSGSWKIVLDSSNYTSYTVTKSGSGASGTWGINITGNSNYANSAGSASSATSANSANYLNIVASNEIRFNKPSWTSKTPLWFGWAWSDGSKSEIISQYNMGNGNGGLAAVAASRFIGNADSATNVAWSGVTGKPSTFTPSAHTHTIANITNLQSTLDSKALNSNTIKGVSANGYWGLATPASNSVDWIRTTSYGLLPSQSGSARSGHSALGTSSWYFSNAYIDSINTSEIKIGQPNNSNNGGIELYGASPYIDFHTSGTNTDYSSRIIAYSDRIEFVFA